MSQNLVKHIDICKSMEFRHFICHSTVFRLLYSTSTGSVSESQSGKRKQFVKSLFHKIEENLMKRGGIRGGTQSRFNSMCINPEEVKTGTTLFHLGFDSISQVSTTNAVGTSTVETNTADTVDALFDLLTETFELKERGNFLRRKALNLVLQHILGGAIERRVTENLRGIVNEETMAARIESLRISLFHTTWPVRSAEDKQKTRQGSSSKMAHLAVELLSTVVGKKNAKRGALKFIWVFQNSVLNRQLLYTILDELIDSFFK
ncbi:hypothetical protein BC830DRAFT_1087897 [Chytriomyces sp. MP71]|nr:hypothetical protein BC830DRAFT_1087897 [Chytriomyces sp. MP71]